MNQLKESAVADLLLSVSTVGKESPIDTNLSLVRQRGAGHKIHPCARCAI